MKRLFDEKNGPADPTQGMLYGASAIWLMDTFPDSAASTTYGLIIPLIAAGAVCLSLIWVLVLRKGLAKSKQFASSQGERYRQFFDNCPDALLIAENEGSIVSANPHACKLFQKEGHDLLAHTCWNFIDQVSLAEFRKKFQLCLAGKPMHCEAGIRIGGGSMIPVEVNGSLQYINGKSLVQLYIRDKSVQRETEEQVRSLYKELEQATAKLEEKDAMATEQVQRAREELIACINHRIRTPLDGIMGMGQLLSDSALSIDQHNCVNTILNSSSNLLKVIDSLVEAPEDILKESEPGAGLADLNAICETLSGKYKALALQKGIELRCDCHDNVPSQVTADEEKLSQVLSGLLDNAFRFTIQGLVMLNIECRRQDSKEAELHFQVIDTGLGIDREFQFPVMELSDDGDGTGTASGPGLAACRQMVKQMGGTIGQSNTVGKGSTFHFGLTLPLAAPRSGTGVDEQPPSFNAPSADSIKDTRILVVDDNKISQKIVVAMLHKAGARVDVADNGKEALSRIREKEYDVVLMDSQMPVMDGCEATARIRSMPEHYHNNVPVIALTAHSLRHELQACRNAGMDDCLIKPVERQKLLDIVARYIREGRIKTALRKAS
jgi:PAS domain S-box-containing protein